jgi:hypothetical protein
MRVRARLILLLILSAALGLSNAGCGGGGGQSVGISKSGATSISVAIFPGTATIPVSTANTPATITFEAVVYNSTNQAVNWAAMGGGTFAGNVFTAPTSSGSVTITATSQADTSKTATVTITVGAPQAVTVTPTAIAVAAGGTQQFTATVNGNVVAATWRLAGAPLPADLGQISPSGMYTAPLSPPPHGTVSIIGTFDGQQGIATATIVFSNASLKNQYTFAYTGQAGGDFLSAVGTFTADGAGNILTGLEDVNSANTVSSVQFTGGTYNVGPDGRTQVEAVAGGGNVDFEITLISNQHALIVRFDTAASGSGTVDLANPAEFSNAAINGFYSFVVSGVDSKGFAEAIAGNFLAQGATGTFPLDSAIQDVNDAGTVTEADTTLFGNIVQSVDSGTGRGTLVFTSTPGGTLNFAFYIVDDTHFKLVEIDQSPSPVLAGDAFLATTPITLLSLNGNYAFTLTGSVSLGPDAIAGVFTSKGTGASTGGEQDENQGGQNIHLQQAIQNSSFSVNPTNSNRILMSLTNSNGTFNFGVYPAANGIVPMVSLSTGSVDSGLAYLQASQTTPQGSYALNLNGVTSDGGQNFNGAIATTNTSSLTGYLDANDNGTLDPNLPLANTTITPTDTFGRGTITMQTASPAPATFLLVYYVVNSTTAVVVEVDGARVTLGMMPNQF